MKAKQLLAIAALFSAASVMAQATLPTFEVQQDGSFIYEMGERGQAAYADWNNDGYMDCLMFRNGADPMLWKNNGDNTFTNVIEDQDDLLFASVNGAAAMWYDYNNDGNLDLIVTGSTGRNADGGVDANTVILYTYRNEGAEGNYLLTEEFELEEDVFYSYGRENEDHSQIIMFPADFNNDGWVDILFCGGYTIGLESTRQVTIWVNDQKGSFVPQNNSEFFLTNGGGCFVADFNNDGLMDICTTGWDAEVNDVSTTTVYLNKGDMTFEPIRGFGHGSNSGIVFPIDYDNNGVLDLIETGRNCDLDGWSGRAFLYVNDGTGKNWTPYDETTTWLVGRESKLAFADINNDGKTDYASSGWAGPIGIYLNNGDMTFEDATDALPSRAWCRGGDLNLVDINNDGLMELHVYGYRDGGNNEGPDHENWPFVESPTWPNYITFIKGVAANQAPAVPTGFTATQNGSDVVLSWTAPADDTTPSAALRYNVYAKNKETGAVFCLTPANIENGFLRVNRVQALLNTTTYTFKGMKVEDYEFGVQAVDNGMRGGLFANSNGNNAVESVKSATVAAYALNGVINVMNGGNAAAEYNVYAVNGAQVAAGNVAAASQVEVALNAGVYVVEVVAADGVAVVKVVL